MSSPDFLAVTLVNDQLFTSYAKRLCEGDEVWILRDDGMKFKLSMNQEKTRIVYDKGRLTIMPRSVIKECAQRGTCIYPFSRMAEKEIQMLEQHDTDPYQISNWDYLGPVSAGAKVVGKLMKHVKTGKVVQVNFDNQNDFRRAPNKQVCVANGCTTRGSKTCTGCMTVRYCSKKCQIRDWKRGAHKKNCEWLADLKKSVNGSL